MIVDLINALLPVVLISTCLALSVATVKSIFVFNIRARWNCIVASGEVWKLRPEALAAYLRNISDNQIGRFITLLRLKYKVQSYIPKDRIEEMVRFEIESRIKRHAKISI